jgi:hypothetical protein
MLAGGREDGLDTLEPVRGRFLLRRRRSRRR